MEVNDIEYLRGLVRMDVRSKTRGLAKFRPRPGQDPAEAEATRQHFVEMLEYRLGVYGRLTAWKRAAGKHDNL